MTRTVTISEDDCLRIRGHLGERAKALRSQVGLGFKPKWENDQLKNDAMECDELAKVLFLATLKCVEVQSEGHAMPEGQWRWLPAVEVVDE